MKEQGDEPMNKREAENIRERLRLAEQDLKKLRGVKKQLRDLDTKFDGLTQACQGMCDTMDKLVSRLAEMTGPEGEVGKKIVDGMQVDMESFYSESMQEVFGEIVKLDDSRVLCDFCNKDWTDSNVSGGIMFSGKSCCPECEPGIEETALQNDEERHITARCPRTISYSEWTEKIIRPLEQVRGVIPGVDIRTLGEWMKFNPDSPKKPGRWELPEEWSEDDE